MSAACLRKHEPSLLAFYLFSCHLCDSAGCAGWATGSLLISPHLKLRLDAFAETSPR